MYYVIFILVIFIICEWMLFCCFSCVCLLAINRLNYYIQTHFLLQNNSSVTLELPFLFLLVLWRTFIVFRNFWDFVTSLILILFQSLSFNLHSTQKGIFQKKIFPFPMKSFDCATFADATQVSHSDDDTRLPVPLTYFGACYKVSDVHQMGTIRDRETNRRKGNQKYTSCPHFRDSLHALHSLLSHRRKQLFLFAKFHSPPPLIRSHNYFNNINIIYIRQKQSFLTELPFHFQPSRQWTFLLIIFT